MENASKALLIAAAVLIVILIVAFAMRIFNSAGDTSKDAQQIGNAITEQSGAASNSTMEAMGYKYNTSTGKWEK